jgi:hypothetical protein
MHPQPNLVLIMTDTRGADCVNAMTRKWGCARRASTAWPPIGATTVVFGI